jgi:hypothetical protein
MVPALVFNMSALMLFFLSKWVCDVKWDAEEAQVTAGVF